jgi:uncharacterized coiled-coil DUF342 family protein
MIISLKTQREEIRSRWSAVTAPSKAREDILTLLQDIDELNKRFPCGHRMIDWNDSYGDCAACVTRQMAVDYDKLPLAVVECHDKIDEIERQLANTQEAAESLDQENIRLRRELAAAERHCYGP